MAAGGMNASPTSPDTSGYSGPAPVFGGGTPFLNPVGGGTPPSMTATPPINPTPAPPQPQMQPAVMPPYGGPQRGPGSSFGGDMDFFGRRGRYENLPADRMPQRDMFGRGRFGFREPPPGVPTWSQQDGIFNYDPNGRPAGGGPFGMFRNMPEGFNPFGGQMPDFATFRQQMQDYIAQRRQQQADRLAQVRSGVSPDQPRSFEDVVSRNGMSVSDIQDRARAAGLGAINPYKPQG